MDTTHAEYKRALDLAKADRAAAALALADIAAYGFPVSRDDALAVAYRDAQARVMAVAATH